MGRGTQLPVQRSGIISTRCRSGVVLGAAVVGLTVVSGCGWPVTSVSPNGSTASGVAGPSSCSTSQLSATVAPGQGAAGTLYSGVVLHNRSGSTCTLHGFPDVSLLDAGRHQMGAAAARSGPSGTTVVLTPGAAATSLFSVAPPACVDGPPRAASYLRVLPPEQTTAITVPASVLACHPLVRALHAGTGVDG